MQSYIQQLDSQFQHILHGYKPIEQQAKSDAQRFELSSLLPLAFLAYQSQCYQTRMYAVFLLGYLSQQEGVLTFLKKTVAQDDNWRVQEVLAKAFDEYCRRQGYENALPTIDEWLNAAHPNVRRAVTEGLRIWTGRDYFKQNPTAAISRLATLKQDESDYVRKSVGNALRDISKKQPDLIKQELATWQLDNKAIQQVYKLASRLL
ncbi:DNA alkylation repair enzyme [Pasteurella multocida]|uniref:DNA alkylation repair protein n=1 Tax=Pasteurella multocida TaxID=747 RepID=UPI000DA328D1|nr:DNA alkylation repair protein [Pasteurella multocida]MDT8780517.1 DNA alkylation repair protein [Pasteurella multocida]SQI52109.1 DNA alkylation repair enzyme [Pasteurella multocida]